MKGQGQGATGSLSISRAIPRFMIARAISSSVKEGCSPILVLGFIETQHPEPIRQAVLQLQQEVVADPYFEGRASLTGTQVAFHAKDDLPEIRYRVFKLLAELDFKAQFVVARRSRRSFATASMPEKTSSTTIWCRNCSRIPCTALK